MGRPKILDLTHRRGFERALLTSLQRWDKVGSVHHKGIAARWSARRKKGGQQANSHLAGRLATQYGLVGAKDNSFEWLDFFPVWSLANTRGSTFICLVAIRLNSASHTVIHKNRAYCQSYDAVMLTLR